MIKRIVAVLICLVLLSGCLGGVEISKRALIQLMGIDYDEGEFKLTLAVFSPSGQTEGGSAEERRQIITAQGATLTEALREVSLRLGRTAFLGDSRAVVIGTQAAKEQMEYILRFLGASVEVYPQLTVLVAQDKAADIVSPDAEENQAVIASSLENITRSSAVEESLCPSSLLSISKSYYSTGAGAPVLRIKRQDEGDMVLFVPDGAVVFSGGQFAGALDEDAHRGLVYLLGLGKGGVMQVDDPVYGKTALEVRGVDADVTVGILGQAAHFAVVIEVECLLNEIPGGAFGDDFSALERIGQAAAEAARDDVLESLWQASALRSDVFGLYRHLRRSEPGFWRENAHNWGEIFSRSSWEVECKVTVSRS